MSGSVAPAAGSRRFPVVFAAVVVLLILAGHFQFWTFGLADTWTFKPDFADTAAILAAGEARQAGIDIYGRNPLDPYSRPHVYGPGWLITGALGLKVADAAWLGWILVGAFVATAAWLLAPRRASELVLAVALVCSPPVLLGIGRGNNDLVVFIMLAAAVWLLLQPRWVHVLAGHVLIAVAALLKMYPAAATAVLLLERRSADGGDVGARWLPGWCPRPMLLAGFAATVAGCGLFVLLAWSHYSRVLGVIPNPPSIFAYGFSVAWTTGEVMHFRPALVTGWIGGLLVVATLILPHRRGLWHHPVPDALARHALVAGAAAWLFCYVTISSFPYRLVLVLLAVRYWFVQTRDPATRRLGFTQLFLWTLVAWLDVPKGLWSELALRLKSSAFDPWTGLNLVIGFEQGLMLGLSLVLGATTLALLRSRHPR